MSTSVLTRSWTVGSISVTSVVESQIDHLSPKWIFPGTNRDMVLPHTWLVPDYADAEGRLSLRTQAFVVSTAGRTILVDPCVGNDKVRSMPLWNEGSWPFLERLADAGFTPDSIDEVVHTHLHPDHIGWDTRLCQGTWVPTFTRARHYYTQLEYDYWPSHQVDGEDIWADSVQPVIDAGLAEVIAQDADLGDGIRLEPAPGHAPGQVVLWLESDGERGLITGDSIHHPVQFAEPHWYQVADVDRHVARTTRLRLLDAVADTSVLVFGTHFPNRPAGHVVPDGERWRFEPV